MKTHQIPIGAYIFRNAFFYQQRPDDPSVVSSFQEQLLTISKTIRNVHLNPHNKRSKYVCKPELVVELGNHFVWQYMPDVAVEYVKPSVALNQHYRICESVCDDSETIVDRTAHRFKDQLATRVHEKWNYLKSQCDLKWSCLIHLFYLLVLGIVKCFDVWYIADKLNVKWCKIF